MNKLFFLFILFSITLNAQLLNIKVLDYSTDLSIDDADVYFEESTKNFVTDLEGMVVVNLADVNPTDELIVSKKDYQDARVKVSDLSQDLTIKLEKISQVDLEEAFITNLKAEDILQKVIDNYTNNFKVDKYYFLANVKQTVIEDSVNVDFIDVDLQFKFNDGNLKIKSTGEVNDKYTKGELTFNTKINTVDYLRGLYLSNILKALHKNILDSVYSKTKVTNANYADKPMYEVYLHLRDDEYCYLLVDKESFSVIEFRSTIMNNRRQNLTLNKNDFSIKFRPYGDSWILKESTVMIDTSFKRELSPNYIINYELKTYNFSEDPFPEFRKSVKEKDDIRKSFK